jgi:hypothetical protein
MSEQLPMERWNSCSRQKSGNRPCVSPSEACVAGHVNETVVNDDALDRGGLSEEMEAGEVKGGHHRR